VHSGGRGRFGEVVGQMLGEGFHGGLGGVVGRVSGRVGNSLFRAGDDYAGRGGGGGYQGEESADAVDYAEEVHGHDFLEVGGVGPASA